MARGAMPPRPPAGGRGQPPRRGGQPAKPGQRPQKQGQKPAQKQGMTQAQKAAQTRHVLEQQRKAAAKANQQQQHRQRQAVFMREAHGQRRRNAAEQRTAEVAEQVEQLESILATGVGRSPTIDLDSLYQTPEAGLDFDPGPLATPYPEPAWDDFAPAGGLLGSLGGKAGQQRREAAAREAYEQARQQWEEAERLRAEQLATAQRAHEGKLARQREQTEQYNGRIARVAAGLRTREPAAVESFLRTVLSRVPLPAGFPRRYEVQHDRETEQVRLRFVLPGPDVVPTVSRYEFRGGVEELRAVPRPEPEIHQLYQSVLAQVTLLVLRDVFEAEPGLAGVRLEGLADRLDPASGAPVFAHLVRVAAERDQFAALELLAEPPATVLGRLPARISPDPYRLTSLPVATG
ncbi:hypothetical protein JQS43_22740 [Natronosporangium hydrolyticum]|uniref:Restriction system protein n=1 Tax=Natronosporangium hydrolyticum TaxID=2811111 RepID=A0A895YAA1_9ACTN|nr:hypothetical protein [Natronosporangium hydrolyticum]QSB14291.1 hypothetical protein JQS43_22740 [Natronosporangium hydrolyticum]